MHTNIYLTRQTVVSARGRERAKGNDRFWLQEIPPVVEVSGEISPPRCNIMKVRLNLLP